MSWWAWLVLVWGLSSIAGAVVVGRSIRLADRRERVRRRGR